VKNKDIGIYKITCKSNKKIYIGQSKGIKSRFSEHKKLLKKNKHCNGHIQNSWNKYGYENFIFEVVEYCSLEVLTKREQYYLDTLKPEFNIAKIAQSSLGIKRKASTIEKIKKRNTTLLGKKVIDEYGNIFMSLAEAAAHFNVAKSQIWHSCRNLTRCRGSRIKYLLDARPFRALMEKKSIIDNFGTIYTSINDAATRTGINSGDIISLLNNKTISYKGYTFSYNLKNSATFRTSKVYKKVQDNYGRSYLSISDAVIITKITRDKIRRSLRTGKQYGGMSFHYV